MKKNGDRLNRNLSMFFFVFLHNCAGLGSVPVVIFKCMRVCVYEAGIHNGFKIHV